jgi:hypothetical protein
VAVEPDGLPDDVTIRVEGLSPQIVAQDRFGRPIRSVAIRGEAAPECGAELQHIKVVTGDQNPFASRGVSAPSVSVHGTEYAMTPDSVSIAGFLSSIEPCEGCLLTRLKS